MFDTQIGALWITLAPQTGGARVISTNQQTLGSVPNARL
jgi:hypothetical protein